MKSVYIKYLVYFLLAALVVVFIQFYFPNPTNWEKNFNTKSKNPYGLYVFNKELPKLLTKQTVTKTALSPYEYFLDNEQTASKTTYLFVENRYGFDEISAKQILEKVSNGADLVIAAESFYYGSNIILDTLNIRTSSIKTNNLHFVAHSSKKDTLKIKDEYNSIFIVKEPEKFTAIARLNSNLSFVSSKFGKGTIYISNTPILLTNYYLLNKKGNTFIFAENFASFLKKEHIVWFDENYDSGEIESNNSIFKVLFQYKSLRFAWYTLIIGLILYMIFYGKRRQRIVPVIEPVKNSTVEYIETVGNLYYQENNHTQLLDKQIKYALHFIRTEWGITTQNLDDDFKNKLQQKSLAAKEDINDFVYFIVHFDKNLKYTQKDLIHFNHLLQKITIDYGKHRK